MQEMLEVPFHELIPPFWIFVDKFTAPLIYTKISGTDVIVTARLPSLRILCLKKNIRFSFTLFVSGKIKKM